MSRRPILLLALVTLCAGMPVFSASAEKKYGPGVSDTEIMIGQTMPYSGPYSSAGAIGRSESAYFQMINAQGDQRPPRELYFPR